MFKFIFNGNIGKDAEVRTLDSGAKVISFVVANNQTWMKNGEKQEKTVWVNCSWWKTSEQSTKVADHLLKGKRVLIEGEPAARAYTNKEGEAQASLEVRVLHLELLGGNSEGGSNNEQSASASAPASNNITATPEDDEDLPF